MTSVGDWGEIIDKTEAEFFVGREQHLDIFRQHIYRTPPRYLIFYITGQGGVGKTTLKNRYREIAKEHDFQWAECDEKQSNVPSVLGHFAQQLAEQGFSLKQFDASYKTYRQKMHEIENDPEAPQGLAGMFGKTMVKAAFIGGDLIPGLRKGLEYLPKEALESQASDWANYLAKKLFSKDDVALVREPIPILTPLFFEDLNQLTQKRKVLLCFENFEATRRELQEWFLRLKEYKPSQNIRVVIAGRDQPGGKWEPLKTVTTIINLDKFTEAEAEAFLDAYHIKDKKRRWEILKDSGRLPVLMSWLAVLDTNESDSLIPTNDIVERFLRWIDKPELREIALLAAIPRIFNVDILKPLLEGRSQLDQEQSAFEWLQTMPFVHESLDGWQYHDVVRRKMLQYQRQKSPQKYRQMHTALASLFNTSLQELSLSEKIHWANEEWRKYTLAYLYHHLVADPNKHWVETISLFTMAVRKRINFAVEIIELLSLADLRAELLQEQNDIVQLFKQQLHVMKDGDLKDGYKLFSRLCSINGLSSEAKGYAFAFRGECNLLDQKWQKALLDFNTALQFIPDDFRTILNRSITFLLVGRIQEALADLSQAISLDEKNTGLLKLRSAIYLLKGRIQEALADLNQAISLDKMNVDLFAARARVYTQMKHYPEALADVNHAISLNEKDPDHFVKRADVYTQMKHYPEALADVNHAISLDESASDKWATAKGLILSYLGQYDEAIECYEVDLHENPNDYVSLYNVAVAMARWKGFPNAQTQIETARAALQVVVDTEEQNKALYGLGGLEALTGNTNEALDYLQQAVQLDDEVAKLASHDIAWLEMLTDPRFQSIISIT